MASSELTASDSTSEENTESENQSEVFFSRGLFTLKSNGNKLRQGLTELWRTKKHSDVAIICGGKRIACHKAVLVTQSEFFHRSLQSPDVSSLIIKADLNIMKLCLEYLYSGKVELNEPELLAVKKLANQLEMSELYLAARALEFQDVTVHRNNCLSIMCVGRETGEISFVEKSKPIALMHFVHLTNHDSFKEMCVHCVKELSSSVELKITAPEQRLSVCLAWISKDQDKRKRFLYDLLVSLPLKSMSPWVLEPLIDHISFQGQPKCQMLLKEIITSEGHSKVSKVDDNDKEHKKQTYLLSLGMREVKSGIKSSSDTRVMMYNLSNPLLEPSVLTQVPAFVPARGHAACCILANELFVSGIGYTGQENWKLDMKTDKWESCGLSKFSRQGHCMAACNGRVYALAGHAPWTYGQKLLNAVSPQDKWAIVREAEMYDPHKTSWEHKGYVIGTTCYNATCCTINNLILIYGAGDGKGYSTVQAFSPSSGRTLATTVLTRSEASQVYGIDATENFVVMLCASGTYVCPVEAILRGDSSKVTFSARFLTPNDACVVTLLGEQVILIGGAPKWREANYFMYECHVKNLIDNVRPNWKPVEGTQSETPCLMWAGASTITHLDGLKDEASSSRDTCSDKPP